ncbi:MAG: hypothetical protein KDA36_03540, partial [Planctomycetaceae bacterium]|nr:hypothetical protein [Planctomycetaceae bacterium]
AALEREREELAESRATYEREASLQAEAKEDLERQREELAEERERFRQECDEWSQRRDEIEASGREYEQLKTELADQQQQIEEESNRLQSQGDEIAAQQAETISQQELLQQQESELSERESQVKQLQTDLEEQRRSLDEESLALESLRAELEELQASLQAREAAVIEPIADSPDAEYEETEAEEIPESGVVLESPIFEEESEEETELSATEQTEDLPTAESELATETIIVDEAQPAVEYQEEADENGDEDSTYRLVDETAQSETITEDQPEEEQPPQKKEIRSVLSEMFGINLDDRSAAEVEASIGEEYALQSEGSEPSSNGSSAPPLDIGDLNEIEGPTTNPEPLATEEIQDSGQQLESVIPISETNEDEESVASYMNRLLARLRSDSNEPAEEPKHKSYPSRVTPELIKPEVKEQEPVVEEELPPLTELPPPVNQQNAEEVREGMKSLRRVANISARSAVASYHWKRTRGHLVFSTILSAGALVAFVYLAMTEGTSELTYAALAVGVVMLGETYRLISKVKKMRDIEGGAGQQKKKKKKSKRSDEPHAETAPENPPAES